jgi:hypothetical protein
MTALTSGGATSPPSPLYVEASKSGATTSEVNIAALGVTPGT